MFEDNYKKAFDNIKPNDSVKESILEKIEAAEGKQEKKYPATVWRMGTAVALAAAIALSIIFIPKNSVKVKAESLTAADSYNEIYKIFADQTRLRILDALLNKPMCVNEISEVLDVSQSAISHQLKNLRTSNLVKAEKEGKNVIYSISDNHIKIILKYGLEHIAEVL